MTITRFHCIGFVLGLLIAAAAIHAGTQSERTTPVSHATGLDTAY